MSSDPCIHPDCECLDYCEAEDPWSKTPVKESKQRTLNPRICRGCGRVFMPETALQRYGSPACKSFGSNYQCRAVPGAEIDHGIIGTGVQG